MYDITARGAPLPPHKCVNLSELENRTIGQQRAWGGGEGWGRITEAEGCREGEDKDVVVGGGGRATSLCIPLPSLSLSIRFCCALKRRTQRRH